MKKILTFILTIVMTASIFPCSVSADHTDSDMAGIPFVLGEETWKINFDAAALDKTAKAAEQITNKSNFAASKTVAALYKMKMPEIPAGKILGSAEFRVTSYYSSARPIKYAYKFPESDYDMTSFTIGDAQKYINSAKLGSGEYYLTSCMEDAAYASDKTYRSRYNITDYIKECMNDNQEYFWIAVTNSNANNAYPHDSTTDYWRPKLFYTVEDAPEFQLLQASPENGHQAVMPVGDVELVFSNTIASAKAFVNGAETNLTDVYSDSVVVNYTAEENTSLEIEVVVTDEYNQSLTITLNYQTARDITVFDDAVISSSYCIGKGLTNDGSDYKNESRGFEGMSPELKLSDGGAVFYELPLPEYDDNKHLSSYIMNVYCSDENAKVRAYEIPVGYNLEDGLFIIKEQNMSLNAVKTQNNVADILYDHDNNKAGETTVTADDENGAAISVELTALARERAKGGYDSMIVALTSDSAVSFSSHISSDEKITAVMAETENSPKIKTHSPEFSLWGNEILSASFGTYTDADAISDGVFIVSDSGEEAENVVFEYNPFTNRIELSAKSTLSESESYSIIIKAGTSDSFGNTLSEDMVVASFETGRNIPVSPDERDDLWSELVTGSDSEVLGEKWHLLTAVFGFDQKLFEDFTDASVFYERFAWNTERKTFVSYSEENVSKVAQIVADIAYEVSKEQKLLKSIWDVSHISMIDTIITDEENAKLLGIEEYVSSYKSLYSTDYINTELTKYTYRDAKAFRDKFIPALEYAINNDYEPSQGGGGSSGVGGGVSKPSVSGSATVGSFGGSAAVIPDVPVVPSVKSFADISDYSWASDAINFLAAKKIVNGKTEREFAPADNVTRAEFIAMIVRMAGLENPSSDCEFSDVSKKDWFYSSVASGVNSGIISGTGNGFEPYRSITREDMALILHRLISKDGAVLSTHKDFADSGLVADYAREAVAVLGGEGIISGMPDGRFEPKQNLTRAQAATVIYNVYTNYIEKGAAK